jgi:hypothetical protein
MSLHVLAGLYLLGLVVVGFFWHRAIERRNERSVDALIDGYTHVARCVCGWEIGADSPEDATLMLALHEVVTLNTALEAS